MNDDERRLSLALKHSVPVPPRPITAEQIRARVDSGQPAHRAVRSWVMAVTAACVLAILAIGGVLAVRTGSHTGPTSQTATRPHALSSSSYSGSAAESPSDTTSPDPAPATPIGPWSARSLLATSSAQSNGMAVGDGAVYLGGAGHISRVDPSTGRVTAEAPSSPYAVFPLLVTPKHLWQVLTTNARLSLQSLDPTSLRVTGTFPLGTPPGSDATGPQGSPHLTTDATGSTLYLAAGSNVYAIDPSSGVIEHQRHLDGSVDAISLSPDDTLLYLGVNHRAGGSPTLVTLGVATGLATNSQTTLTSTETISEILATSGGIWMTLAGGHFDVVVFATASDPSHPHQVSSGGGGMPSTVSLANNTVWIGGPTQVSCADPVTGHLRASAAVPAHGGGPSDLSNIGYVAERWVAHYIYGTETGLAQFTPPPTCG